MSMGLEEFDKWVWVAIFALFLFLLLAYRSYFG